MPPTTRVWLQRILSLQSPKALPRIFPIVSVILDDWWNCLNPQDTAVLLEKSRHWLNSTGRWIELDKIYRATLPQTRISICCPKCGTCAILILPIFTFHFRQLLVTAELRVDKHPASQQLRLPFSWAIKEAVAMRRQVLHFMFQVGNVLSFHIKRRCILNSLSPVLQITPFGRKKITLLHLLLPQF